MTTHWSVHVAAAVVLAQALTACRSGDVPITDRAVAVVALDHVPGPPDLVRDASPSDAGYFGAFLEYRNAGSKGSDELLVNLFEPGSTPGVDCAEDSQYDGCNAREVAAGTLTLAWEEGTPDEDPGSVVVELAAGDRLVTVSYHPATRLTGDPETSRLRVGLKSLEALAQDKRLAFSTTRGTVEAGKKIPDWGVQPDPVTAEVPSAQ